MQFGRIHNPATARQRIYTRIQFCRSIHTIAPTFIVKVIFPIGVHRINNTVFRAVDIKSIFARNHLRLVKIHTQHYARNIKRLNRHWICATVYGHRSHLAYIIGISIRFNRISTHVIIFIGHRKFFVIKFICERGEHRAKRNTKNNQ